ncbi:LysM repeat protein [Pseudarthrobacter defluvii]|uniref:LysM peptidoglycan-binding domain-containing protein n=1 Tax=Pseudarthrobacter defluvii TaxID=410837 RepID=UPI002787E200|nr:LysM domain-containing protein [Pseudarthrobacter defluvii]MDQ0768162.1 LysM repeat protein [Pseudarthrobacter defluvii]
MNKPFLPSPDGTSRSFATDEPRTELSAGHPGISNKLWAGMATAAVVAAVGVGALAAPPASVDGGASAAAQVAESAPPPSPSAAAEPGDAAGPGAAAVPAVAAQPEAPATEAPPAPPVEPAPAPAPEPEAAPAPEPAGDSNLYTVVPGDTVGAIAAAHGVDMDAMLAANGLSAYSVIYPGETLLLTGPPIAVAVPAPVPVPATAPAAAPVAAQAPAPAPPVVPAAPAVRTIYVAGSGGQSMVDACIGPIHYTPNDGYSLFITEHDFCGGWARFSGIGVGETVSIPGYGTYTVTGRGTVPNPGTTNDVIAAFGGFPRAILQTCIPGTSTMLLIALN